MLFKCYAMMQHYQGRIHQNCPDHILSVNFSSLCPERGSAYFMGLELHPCFALQDGAWHILVAPMLMLTAAMNRHLCLQRFSLFICGRCSWVLSLLDCRFFSWQVHRAISSSRPGLYLRRARQSLLQKRQTGEGSEDQSTMEVFRWAAA
jgi:hypothetical protein